MRLSGDEVTFVGEGGVVIKGQATWDEEDFGFMGVKSDCNCG